MVVAADDVFLAGDVGMGEEAEQPVFGFPSSAWAMDGASRRGPAGAEGARWAAVVHEVHGELGYYRVSEAQLHQTVITEDAEDRGFDPIGAAALDEARHILAIDREHHALLGLREPDLPGCQTLVLQGDEREIDLETQLGSHLSGGGAQASGPAVCDRVVELFIAQDGNDVAQLLLHYGGADLNGTGGDGFPLQGCGGHGRAVESIAAGASAEQDDSVARPGISGMTAVGQNTRGTAEDERIGGETGVEEYGPADGGDAHVVAVITDTTHDLPIGTCRVEAAGRHVLLSQVWRSEAEDVGVGDGLGGDGEHVANDAPDARVCAAVGLERGRMIVGLDLEGEIVATVEGDDSSVVNEGGTDPGARQSRGGFC